MWTAEPASVFATSKRKKIQELRNQKNQTVSQAWIEKQNKIRLARKRLEELLMQKTQMFLRKQPEI